MAPPTTEARPTTPDPTATAPAAAAGPIRTCIGCRRRAPVDELVRFVRREDGTLALGRSLDGRGAWLCAGSTTCARLAVRRRAIPRALRATVSAEAVEALVVAVGAQDRINSDNGVRVEGHGARDL